MDISNDSWRQIKSITTEKIIRALKKDGWVQEETRGATIGFLKEKKNSPGYNRVVIHYHPKKTYGPTLLKKILSDTGWNDSDLMRLKLIKKKKS